MYGQFQSNKTVKKEQFTCLPGADPDGRMGNKLMVQKLLVLVNIYSQLKMQDVLSQRGCPITKTIIMIMYRLNEDFAAHIPLCELMTSKFYGKMTWHHFIHQHC